MSVVAKSFSSWRYKVYTHIQRVCKCTDLRVCHAKISICVLYMRAHVDAYMCRCLHVTHKNICMCIFCILWIWPRPLIGNVAVGMFVKMCTIFLCVPCFSVVCVCIFYVCLFSVCMYTTCVCGLFVCILHVYGHCLYAYYMYMCTVCMYTVCARVQMYGIRLCVQD